MLTFDLFDRKSQYTYVQGGCVNELRMDGTINTAENGSLSSEDRDNTSSIEREGTDINRNGSPERHQISSKKGGRPLS